MVRRIILCFVILMIPSISEAQERLLRTRAFNAQPIESHHRETSCQSRFDGSNRLSCFEDRRLDQYHSPVHRPSMLDQLLLLIDHHRRVTLDTGLGPNTKVDFEIEQVNFSKLQADVKVTFKIKF